MLPLALAGDVQRLLETCYRQRRGALGWQGAGPGLSYDMPLAFKHLILLGTSPMPYSHSLPTHPYPTPAPLQATWRGRARSWKRPLCATPTARRFGWPRSRSSLRARSWTARGECAALCCAAPCCAVLRPLQRGAWGPIAHAGRAVLLWQAGNLVVWPACLATLTPSAAGSIPLIHCDTHTTSPAG